MSSKASSNRAAGATAPPPAKRSKKLVKGPRVADIERDILDRLLTARVTVHVNGRPEKVTALEAIMLQVYRQSLQGDDTLRATRLFLKYVELVPKTQRAAPTISLVEDHYTTSVTNLFREDTDGR